MKLNTDLRLEKFDRDEARSVLDSMVVPVWEDSHRELIATNPFYSTPRFLERFQGYSSAPGFSMCAATTQHGAPVGITFGYTLQPGARWWNGLLTEVPDGFIDEDGHRTFAVNEIMVVESERRRGVATALHRALLTDRPESRATLLVNPANTPAREAYLSWGWRPIGTLKPFPDSPTYESMILKLPATRSALQL